MSLSTRHDRFTSMLETVNLKSLRIWHEGLEAERIEAIARGNGDHLRFCDERLRILELEIAKRERDDA